MTDSSLLSTEGVPPPGPIAPRPTETPPSPRRPRGWWAWVLLPVVLFAVSTVLFGWDLGHLGDDNGGYMRVPETGAIKTFVFDAKYYLNRPFEPGRGTFWRPFFAPYFSMLTNLCWNHPWVQNLWDALIHLWVAGMLVAVLRALRINRAAAIIAATLFLVYPAPMQVVFWKASSGTSLAVGLLLTAYLAAIAYARRPTRHGLLIWLALLGFAVPAFNEQPAPSLAAIPLFFLAGLPRGVPLKSAWVRLVLATAAAGSTCALYATMLMLTGPKLYQPIGVEELAPRTLHMLKDLWISIRMDHYVRPAFAAGWGTLAAGGAASLIALGAVVAAAGPWLARLRFDAEGGAQADPERPRHWLVLLAGAAAFALSLPAIIAIAMYTFWESRYMYAPAATLAVLVGLGLDVLVRGWRTLPERARRLGAPVWQGGLMAVLLAGTIATIGTQDPFRRRSNADRVQAQALKAVIPDPPEDAFFMPMLVLDAKRSEAGERWDVPWAYSVWFYPWGIRSTIPLLYRRSDLRSGYGWSQTGQRVMSADEQGFCYREILPAPGNYELCPGGWRVPWEKTIPFMVLEDGTVALITKLRLPDGAEVAMPALRGLVETGALPERSEALVM